MDFSQYNLLVIGYPSNWKVATLLIGAKACSKLLVSMFTGIIQNLGVLRRRRTGVLEVEVPASIRERLTVGASIAVNGVCVTVSELSAGTFSAGISQQTLSRTTIGRLKERTPVNLELPVGPERAFDGHIVLGHVDTIGRVRGFFRAGEGRVFIFSFAREFCRYVADKGAVSVDGISLTPFAVSKDDFRCAVIPQTLALTNLQYRAKGDSVNLEFDILAKYVEGMIKSVY